MQADFSLALKLPSFEVFESFLAMAQQGFELQII